MAGRVEWNAEPFKAQLTAEMRRRVNASCIMVEDHAKQLISVPGTAGGGQRNAQGRFIKGSYSAIQYNVNPSKPGEPPHKQHGRLRASVTREVSNTKPVGRVGTNVKYGRWLELGTRKMKARPWLRVALKDKRGVIIALLTKRIKTTK